MRLGFLTGDDRIYSRSLASPSVSPGPMAITKGEGETRNCRLWISAVSLVNRGSFPKTVSSVPFFSGARQGW